MANPIWIQTGIRGVSGSNEYPEIQDSPLYDKINNRWCWRGDGNDWYITDTLGFELYYNENNTASEKYWMYNGKRAWKIGTNYLWWDTTGNQWVISRMIGGGINERWRLSQIVEVNDTYRLYDLLTKKLISTHSTQAEAETAKDEYEKYVGDDWYSSSTLENIYVPRGNLRGETANEFETSPTIEIHFEIEGYKRSWGSNVLDGAGVYEGYHRIGGGSSTSDPSNTALVGLPTYEDEAGREYIRSLNKSWWFYNQYTYICTNSKGWDISYTTVSTNPLQFAWVIGQVNSDNGWYESLNEPEIFADVTFTAKRHPKYEDEIYNETPNIGYPDNNNFPSLDVGWLDFAIGNQSDGTHLYADVNCWYS